MADRLGREDQGIKIDLLEIFLAPYCFTSRLQPLDTSGMIRRSAMDGRKPHGGDHFHPGNDKRALENQVRERDRRLQRISECAEPTLPENRLLSSGTPCGWMNKGTPSCSLGPPD